MLAGLVAIAVLLILLAAKDAPASVPRDEGRFGVPCDWLVPDNPATINHARERIRSFAAVKDLAGIVLRDVLPPGYRGAGETDDKALTWRGGTGVIAGRSLKPLSHSSRVHGGAPMCLRAGKER